MRLNEKHRKIAVLFASGMLKKQIAEVVGVHPNTVTRTLKNPLVKEIIDSRKHDHAFGVANSAVGTGPTLPNRGCPAGDHIPPTRIVGLIEHVIHDLAIAFVTQDLDHTCGAGVSGMMVAAVIILNIFNRVLEDFLSLLFGHDTQGEGQKVRRLRAGDVVTAF